MKIFLALVLTGLFAVSGFSQDKKVHIVNPDSIIKAENVPTDTNSKKILVKDTVGHIYNMYVGLLEDNPAYNKKRPWWQPAAVIVGQNIGLNLVDHYILHLPYASVGLVSWSHTLTAGAPWSDRWVWDVDRFGNNFFLHPLTGSYYYTAARSAGYHYGENWLFTFGGSYFWKLFCETGDQGYKPERNDLIATTVGGVFGGEVLYRLSSNILDDRTTGSERFWREFAAGILAPTRFVNRLIQGKLSTVTTEEVYQKEPLDIVLSGGLGFVNEPGTYGYPGNLNLILNADFDYGDPFEKRDRHPFDYFTLRTDLSFGLGRKLVDNIIGYGIIWGKNITWNKIEMLAGIAQHYDYWDNNNFEIGTMGFGPTLLTKMSLAKNTNLYANFHLEAVPFGANSTEHGPDPTAQTRDYYFSGGAESKVDATINFEGIASLTILGYYYWMHTYVGTASDDHITILKPRLEIHLAKNWGIGYEHLIYTDNRNFYFFPDVSVTKTTEKLFFTLYLADFLHSQ